jgi:hypothetical protein
LFSLRKKAGQSYCDNTYKTHCFLVMTDDD